MNKYIGILILLCVCILIQPAMAQQEQQKTLKESMADLKKSFHPDKAFVLPFTDSTNEDLQAFLFSVKDTKGVKGAVLTMKDKKAIITVDTKGSMVSIWNNLPKEFRNRYTVADRTPQGFILTDSYQSK
ncbi:MAG: hypothetical protein ACRDE5_16925 [Ginsengibacter sp.]